MRAGGGFTLIEVMVTVAIVAIIAAFALPSYTDYITRSKLQEATSNLLAQRTKLEQYFQDNRTYVGACASGTVAPLPTGLKYFTITCPTLSATQYIVRADGGVAGGDQTLSGAAFTINEANTRATVTAPAGWAGAGSNCWVSRRSGTC